MLRRDPKPISPAEEAIYELVAGEIASERMSPGLFAKAFSDAEGDQGKAIAICIGYRVAQLREELERDEQRVRQDDEAKRRGQADEDRARWAKIDAEDERIAQHERRIGRKWPDA